MPRNRVQLNEPQPSQVLLVKHGKRSTEKLLLQGELNAMINQDGTVSIEVHNGDRSILLRMSPDDVKTQAYIFREWRNLK